MKYLFTLILSFLLLQPFAYGQVPGYMGKRAWISADFNFAPALFNMNQNHMVIKSMGDDSRAKGQNIWAINYRPEFRFEYLVGRDVALGVSYSRLKTGTVKELELNNPELSGIYYDLLKGDGFGFHLKKFKYDKSASIAPIGYYWTLGITAASFNTYSSRESEIGQFAKGVTNPVITWGVGKQKVLFDRLLLTSGMEFGWSFLPKDVVEEFKGNGYEPHANDISIHHAYTSMFGYYLFNMKVSCGYLAF